MQPNIWQSGDATSQGFGIYDDGRVVMLDTVDVAITNNRATGREMPRPFRLEVRDRHGHVLLVELTAAQLEGLAQRAPEVLTNWRLYNGAR